VLLGMIASIPTQMGTVRHCECEVTHTLHAAAAPRDELSVSLNHLVGEQEERFGD
jgi:hypothetical protein